MRPSSYAAVLAAGYASVAVVYILVSSSFAASEAHSVEDLARVEMIKGVIYVAVTSLLVFAGGWLMATRLSADARKLLERERALLVIERRGLAGLLASSVAHDANNVLTAVLADVDELRDAPDPLVLDRLEASARRLVGLHRRLLQVGKKTTVDEKRAIDLAACVTECVDGLRSLAKVKRCRLSVRSAEGLSAAVYPVLVHQMVSNLVLNAADATEGVGRIDVSVRRGEGEIVLQVDDDGPGIPEPRRAGLFDALKSTKPDGAGLGLFSVKACAESHGGKVEVLESALGGACFRVSWPVVGPAAFAEA